MNQGLTALARRDQALAELDRGDAEGARAASDALVLLETAGQGESPVPQRSWSPWPKPRRAWAISIWPGWQPGVPRRFWPQPSIRRIPAPSCCGARLRNGWLVLTGPGATSDGAAARLVDLISRAARILGPGSEAVVSAENALGVVHKYAGDFDDAEATYGRALHALQESGRRDPLAEAGLCHNLGGLACSRGSPDAGIPHAERGLALRIEAAGHDHPDTGRDLNALGVLYHQAGRLDEARAAYRNALVIFESAYGPDHFEVGMTCANLAVLAGDEDNHMEAETLGLRSLGILENGARSRRRRGWPDPP